MSPVRYSKPEEYTPPPIDMNSIFSQGIFFFIIALLGGIGLFVYQGWFEVREGEMAILIKKTGEAPGKEIDDKGLLTSPILAPFAQDGTKPSGDSKPENLPDSELKYKGIQLRPLGEGWHFINPYTWEYEIQPQVKIKNNEVGVLIQLFGKPLDHVESQVLATEGQMGIMKEVLKPGAYLINPYAFRVEIHPAVQVPEGFRGVVTWVAGKIPKDCNSFIVQDGERGISMKTLPPGTYYRNPYEQQVIPIEIRSQRFGLTEISGLQFPSFDGFLISMEGNIEWRIDQDKVAEVYVRYIDPATVTQTRQKEGKTNRSLENAILKSCIEDKVIMPNARAFLRLSGSKYLAKDYIAGETREKLQQEFYKGIYETCKKENIVIEAARITKCNPPEEIREPIREREKAIRNRDRFKQDIERTKAQIDYATEATREQFEVRSTKADTQVKVSIKNANREKEVAIIEQQKNLEVAMKRLEAAKYEAQSIIVSAQAESEVLRMRNKAEASGLEDATHAFGSGKAYAEYLLLEKIGNSMKYILANTDSPFLEVFRRLVKQQGKNFPETDAVKQEPKQKGE